MQVLYVMQGASGSGKSTVAAQLSKTIPNSVVYSTDDFHMEGDEYVFKPQKLAEFHKKNLERSIRAMDEGKTVIVDNTNIKLYEPKGYVQHAIEKGIPVIFIRVNGNFQNTHGVPKEKVEMMKKNMQNLTVEDVLKSKTPW